ncbi:MAG: cupin domain-containing protein [Pseudomonadota bacterium]
MEIIRAGARPTRIPNPAYFTGSVTMDPVISAPEPARLQALVVSFAPGARTHWHTHPLGQTLFVLSGVGRVQREGEPIRALRPGDTVWIPPGVRHWHGAAPETAMRHMAMQEEDGTGTDWAEAVSDADYRAEPAE